MTLRERFYGWAASKLLVHGARLALARLAGHEAQHYAAALIYGNNGHPGGLCPIPSSYQRDGDAYLADCVRRRSA